MVFTSTVTYFTRVINVAKSAAEIICMLNHVLYKKQSKISSVISNARNTAHSMIDLHVISTRISVYIASLVVNDITKP